MKRGLLLAVLLVAVAGGSAPGRAASPPRIVFSADLAPKLSGEIYRVDPNGRVVDLSRSPYQDLSPTVSSDGKQVAFFSDRTGGLNVYEVGVDGRRLAHVGPVLTQPIDPLMAWQPRGRHIAIVGYRNRRAESTLWIAERGKRSIEIPHDVSFLSGAAWSPDGHVLLAARSYGTSTVDAYNPEGKRLWSVAGTLGYGSWSKLGMLALTTVGGMSVYDEAGHRVARVRVHLGNGFSRPVWASDGHAFAELVGKRVYAWSASGRTLLSRRVQGGPYAVVWVGDAHVAVAGLGTCLCERLAFGFRGSAPARVSPRWFEARSADGRLAALTAPSGSRFAIQVARTSGGPAHTYTHVPGCDEDGGWAADADLFQFVANSRSLVYESDCAVPQNNLFSVSPGGPVQRITDVRNDQANPALSPDGSEIAYSWTRCAGTQGCAGNPSGIRVVGSDGNGERILTSPPDCTYDIDPTWSPDGSTILFSHSGCSFQAELFTVPAAGGTPHDLGVVGSEPAWGPSKIAYLDGDTVWTSNPDGTDPARIGAGSNPAWSADGRLAYLTGSHVRTLVAGSSRARLPFALVTSLAWSPDGTRLVVTARRTTTEPLDVYTVKPDGTDPMRLTQNYGAAGASWR